jgi:hypothetical protein
LNLGFLDYQFAVYKRQTSCSSDIEPLPLRALPSSDGNKTTGTPLNTTEISKRTTCHTLLLSQMPSNFFSVACAKHPCCQDLGIVTPSVRGICVLNQIISLNNLSLWEQSNWMKSWNVCQWTGVSCSQDEINQL